MNRTIKVIDLLNIIAIGIEEIPLTIKCGNNIYWWDNKNKQYHNGTECYFNLSFHTNELNNTVEIIEEEPEIDEIGKMAGWALVSLEEDIEKQKENINFTLDFFGKKINEIISNQNKIAKAINQINNK